MTVPNPQIRDANPAFLFKFENPTIQPVITKHIPITLRAFAKIFLFLFII